MSRILSVPLGCSSSEVLLVVLILLLSSVRVGSTSWHGGRRRGGYPDLRLDFSFLHYDTLQLKSYFVDWHCLAQSVLAIGLCRAARLEYILLSRLVLFGHNATVKFDLFTLLLDTPTARTLGPGSGTGMLESNKSWLSRMLLAIS